MVSRCFKKPLVVVEAAAGGAGLGLVKGKGKWSEGAARGWRVAATSSEKSKEASR